MNLPYWLRKALRKKQDFTKIEGVPLKHAFTIEHQKFYEPEDAMNFPYQRGLAIMEAYNQMQLGVFPADIEYICEKVDAIFNRGKVTVDNMIEIKMYHNRLRERYQSQFRHPELLYKLASVTFIDETESPFIYDAVHAQRKIDFWKKHKSVTDFFLQIPLQRLIPYLCASEANSKFFLSLTQELLKEESSLQAAFTNTSAKQKSNLRNSQSASSSKATGRNSKT